MGFPQEIGLFERLHQSKGRRRKLRSLHCLELVIKVINHQQCLIGRHHPWSTLNYWTLINVVFHSRRYVCIVRTQRSLWCHHPLGIVFTNSGCVRLTVSPILKSAMHFVGLLNGVCDSFLYFNVLQVPNMRSKWFWGGREHEWQPPLRSTLQFLIYRYICNGVSGDLSVV